jgi:predicted nucleotidyltransferase
MVLEGDKMEKEILNVIKRQGKPLLVYIFGSYVTERYNSESDIDIAVLFDKKIKSMEKYEMKMELVDLLGREVDLIDLFEGNLILAKEIIYKGKLIYKKDQKTKEEFEYRSVVLYNQYRDDSQIIIDKIKERRRVL